MSNEHVERRAGQRWRATFGDGSYREGTLAKHDSDGWDCLDNKDGFSDMCWPGKLTTVSMTLISDVPSPRLQGSADGRSWFDCTGGSCGHVMHREATGAVDRSKCRPWCGHKTWNDSDARKRLGRDEDEGWPIDGVVGSIREVWCTEQCKVARVPPLESKPAETRKFISNQDYFAKPPAQEAPKTRECGSCVKAHPTVLERVRKGGRILLCEPCMLAAEVAQGNYPSEGQRLRDLPERLPAPRLAHSFGIEDPALEDV